jgi:ABC-type nitrate/sulfonate/bicarbonate transport system substrate-binding protein
MKALKRVLLTIVAMAGFLGTEVAAQEPLEVTIIYGPIPRPTHVAMVKGWYEEEMNRVRPVKIVWKYFEFGPPMIAAIASNSVDLTTVVGTIPTIVAIEQGVDLYIVYPLTGRSHRRHCASWKGCSDNSVERKNHRSAIWNNRAYERSVWIAAKWTRI